MGTKPLIFVEPLSQTLQKLKEVIEANADKEGIEIFEVEEMAELGQIIPTIGQALVLTSSPKKCAVFLQTYKRVVKKIGTKTILLSPKAIPRKTLDKFMKVGLTECVVEPVNPKTLLYKVRLQLRSIVVEKKEEERSKTFKSDAGENQVDNNSKMRAGKGVILDDEGDEDTGVKNKKQTEEVTMEDPRKAKKKTYQEEAIDSYYKGKKKREEVEEYDEEGNKKKKAYQEEAIEAHYKGKLDKAEEVEEEEVEKKKKKNLQLEEYEEEEVVQKAELEIEDDPIARVKKEIAEEYDEDTNKRKKALNIDIEDDEPKFKEREEQEDLGGHYKGKLNQNQLDVEDDDYLDEKEKDEVAVAEEEKKKKARLELVEDDPDYHEKKEVEEESLDTSAKKKKAQIDIDDDEEKDYIDRPEELLEEEKKKKARLDLVEDEEDRKDAIQEAVLEEEKEDKKQDAKADEIDGYLRGGAAKKIKVEEDDEDLYRDEALEEEYAEKKRKKEALTLEDDYEKDPLLDEKEYDDDFNKKKKAEKLLVDDDEGFGKREKMLAENDSELGRRKSKYREDEKGGFSKGKGAGKNEEDRGPGNRADARADHIKTHYSSKESLKHGDQDWDSKWDKKAKPQDDFGPMNQEEKELIIEKEELGEQTIDYGQLKKEFEGISIDGVANKKKQYGSFDNVIKPKTYKKKVAGVEGELEEMEFEEVEEENAEVEGEQVFEPESLGMEIAIEVQDFYFSKDIDTEKLCAFLNEKMGKAFRGDLVFYSFSKEELPAPFYNGLVKAKAGDEPEKLPESELEGYNRLERRELENDYKNELAAYKKELSEANEEWESNYGNLLEEWKAYKTPDWKDHTFQAEDNHFVFPFYEGVTLMGLAVFIPEERFDAVRSDALEAVFEVARGIFITEYHQNKGEGKIREKKAEKPKEEKKGLFGKLFGKAG